MTGNMRAIPCLLTFLCAVSSVQAGTGLRGELVVYTQSGETPLAGWHYLPEIQYQKQVSDQLELMAEAGCHARWNHPFRGFEFAGEDLDLDLYRMNARLQTRRTETVLGLQKLNFGPGRILRPLMWFDELDPSDPLGITKGVTGLSFDWYTPWNLMLKTWLLQSGRRKGWELFHGVPDTPEYGCHLGYPLMGGELGFSFHTREPELSTDNLPSDIIITLPDLSEYRCALDGFWDMEIGLWFEHAEIRYLDKSTGTSGWNDPSGRQTLSMLGVDYTFGLGNGVHILMEHLQLEFTMKPFFPESRTYDLTAFTMDYPMGFFDRISATFLWHKEEKELIQVFTWNRTYDYLGVSVSIFSYPDTASMLTFGKTTGMGGTGIQLILTFIH